MNWFTSNHQLKWFIVILKIHLPHYLTHNPSVYLFRDQQVRQDQWESEATLDPQDHPVNRVYLDLREKREQRCEQIQAIRMSTFTHNKMTYTQIKIHVSVHRFISGVYREIQVLQDPRVKTDLQDSEGSQAREVYQALWWVSRMKHAIWTNP